MRGNIGVREKTIGVRVSGVRGTQWVRRNTGVPVIEVTGASFWSLRYTYWMGFAENGSMWVNKSVRIFGVCCTEWKRGNTGAGKR